MPRRIVFTGGPSGGKTSMIEVAQRHFGRRIITVPEAATILYQGGFPRGKTPARRKAAQRAIYRVTLELERWAAEEGPSRIALCDRGTLDSGAYWPGGVGPFLKAVGSTRKIELARYAAVIHMSTPAEGRGYHQSPTRIESAREAMALDRRVRAVWAGHPHLHVVHDETNFLDKVDRVIEILEREIRRLR